MSISMTIASLRRSALSLIVVLAALACGPARAYDTSATKPVPSYVKETDESAFDRQTKLVEEQAVKDESLKFSVRVPADWNKQSFETGQLETIGQGIAGDIATYNSPPGLDARSSLTVKVASMSSLMGIYDWYVNFLFANGYTLQGLSGDDRGVEALYVLVQGDTSYVVRSRAIPQGTRVVIVSNAMPDAVWMKSRAQQELMVRSFALLAPDEGISSQLTSFKFFDLASLDYPRNWVVRSQNMGNISRMSVVLINSKSDGPIDGRMEISLVAKEPDVTLGGEAKHLRDSLAEKGLELGARIEKRQFNFQPQVTSSHLEVYAVKTAQNKVKAYELWVVLAESGEFYYAASLLTPSRKEDFLTWAHNRKAFEIAMSTLSHR